MAPALLTMVTVEPPPLILSDLGKVSNASTFLLIRTLDPYYGLLKYILVGLNYQLLHVFTTTQRFGR